MYNIRYLECKDKFDIKQQYFNILNIYLNAWDLTFLTLRVKFIN